MTQTRAHHLLSQYCCARNYLVPRLFTAAFKLVFIRDILLIWAYDFVLSHATPRAFPCSVVITSYLIMFTLLPYSRWRTASTVRYGMQSLTFELWCQT